MSISHSPAETYRHEAEELLQQVEEIAVGLQPGAGDADAINRLFRAFHTIKGSGSMFGFVAVAAFTHHVETMLDGAREGRLAVSREMIALILAARDHIAVLLTAEVAREPAPVADGEAIVTACQELSGTAAGAPAPAEAPVDNGAAGAAAGLEHFRINFRPAVNLMIAGTDPCLLLDEVRALGDCTIEPDLSALPPLGELQPDGCYFAWRMELDTDRGESAIRDVFMFVEDGAELRIERLTAAPATAGAAPTRTEALPRPEPPVAPAPAPAPATRAGKRAPTANGDKSAPVRVDSERLDLLVNLVGELVMTRSRIAQVAATAGNPMLDTPVEDLERIVGAIRDAVLGIRMMPIGSTFNRFKRLVHDLSAELGKEIDLHIVGEETELDKTVLDQLGDPLVHLVRNSIDHGIEPPDERERLGKPRRATVTLAAAHEGSNVVVTISDDGRGFNVPRIREKAIERGLIAADAVLTEKEALGLVFLPGFSTAEAVTNVSGRGVGMDVVRRQIDALRGVIQVENRCPNGSSIALSLPLTLAIIEGQLVEIAGDQFILPMSAVAENVELEVDRRESGNGRNVVAVRGELLSYIRLRDLFEIRGPAPELEKIVIVSHEGQRVGLVVDRVLGSHQTVIQSLGRFYRNIEVASGATIMGDGRVALILDLAGLVRAANRDCADHRVAQPALA